LSLLSYVDLCDLVHRGVIDALPENINGASIDVRLGNRIMLEKHYEEYRTIDLSKRESVGFSTITMNEDGFLLHPGDFILAETIEIFNLPDNIACQFVLKSSMARAGLEHLQAGWCDPVWNGSVLTMELKNITEYHKLRIKPGMEIGQMVFWKCAPVPKDKSYAVRGAYNGIKTAVASRARPE
jgi:dCTP deaminase